MDAPVSNDRFIVGSYVRNLFARIRARLTALAPLFIGDAAIVNSSFHLGPFD